MSAAESVWAVVSGLPRGKREGRALMVLQAWTDDSGMNQQPVYILAGWIADAARWAEFSDEWDKVLRMRPRLRYFKFSEAMNLAGEFSGWSKDLRNERVNLLVALIERHNPLGVSCVVPHAGFLALSERLDGAYGRFFNDGYAFSFYRLISRVLRHFDGSGDKIEFIFDSQPDKAKKVLSIWDEFLQNTPERHRSLISGWPSFKSDTEFMPLQAADLHAGWVRRLDAAALLGEPISQPLWGQIGDSVRRINWVMTDDVMEDLSRALLGYS